MSGEFWLTDAQWATLEPYLPTNQPGTRRTDDQQIISGIVHLLKHDGRSQDVPSCYGPPTTVYNRYHRWSGRGIWTEMLDAVIEKTPGDLQLIDSTTARAHRCAVGAQTGADAYAIGCSRGGRGTKVHLVRDQLGRVLGFALTAG